MKVLFLGDIVASMGRKIVTDLLPDLKHEYEIDFTIANGENATHGKGLSYTHYAALMSAGIDCITMGNHFFRVHEILDKNDLYVNMVRPANFHPSVPGQGSKIFDLNGIKIRVINLIGKAFIEGADSNPFDKLDEILKSEKADLNFVDFHAEATGEKMALARAFDGRISALVGTHTHVQTNDPQVLPQGTGFLSDAGMCGGYDTILGDDPEPIISRNWNGMPAKYTCPRTGRAILCGAVFDLNERTGLCNSVTSIQRFENIDNQ